MSHSAADRPLSILVVDDVPDAVDSLAAILTLNGFSVRTASSGPDALRAAAAAPPDVVFTDLAMPGMTGWELIRRLREQLPDRRLFVVAVTGCAREEDHRKSVDAGIDLHLIKPVDLPTLVAVLERVRWVTPAPAARPGRTA
jgi:CheY-like chemotaxis protein